MGAKFSSGGGATVFYDKTDTPGEIVTELVNASDGAGLHFDGVAGGIDLGSSMPDLGTQYSLEFIVNGDSKTGETYLLDAYKSGARIIFGWSGYSNGNIQLHINGTWSSAFMATPDNGEVVHLVLSVDGTSATLYQNGNSVSTQTVVANTMASATSTRIGCSQNGTGNFFNGTIYRARFYNRALSSTDVQTAYEHASVVQTLRWGDSKILNGTAWTGASGTTPPTSWTAGITGVFTIDSSSGSGNEPSLKITRSSNNPYIYQTFTSVVGRRYRVRYRVKNIDATNVIVGIGSTAGPSEEYNQSTYTSTSWANYEATFTATTVNFGVYVQVSTTTGTQSGYIDSLEVFEDSLASDYDLAFANPTQSLMVQDRTGEADGTATATGVTQVQPVVQLNSTSARIGTTAATPADGELCADSVTVGKSSDNNTGKLDYSSSSGYLDLNAYSTGGSTAIRLSTSDSGANATRLTVASDGNIRIGNQTSNIDNLLKLDVANGNDVFLGIRQADQIQWHIGQKASDTKLYFRSGNVGSETDHLSISSTGVISTTGEFSAESGSDYAKVSESNGLALHRHPAYISNYKVGGVTRFQTSNSSSGDTVAFEAAGSGLVTFKQGIAFDQTDSTAASNITATLDHYERGVWTPVIADAATGGNTGSGSTVTGYYERIGNAVTVTGLATNVNTTDMTGTNALYVRGLPFPSGYSSGTFGDLGRAVGSCVLDSVNTSDIARNISTMVTAQNSYFLFHQTRDSGGDSNLLVNSLTSGTADLFFTFTYFVD